MEKHKKSGDNPEALNMEFKHKKSAPRTIPGNGMELNRENVITPWDGTRGGE